MQNMRLLEDIFVRDPYFVRAEKGWLLFLSHDKPADDSYEGVDVCFLRMVCCGASPSQPCVSLCRTEPTGRRRSIPGRGVVYVRDPHRGDARLWDRYAAGT